MTSALFLSRSPTTSSLINPMVSFQSSYFDLATFFSWNKCFLLLASRIFFWFSFNFLTPLFFAVSSTSSDLPNLLECPKTQFLKPLFFKPLLYSLYIPPPWSISYNLLALNVIYILMIPKFITPWFIPFSWISDLNIQYLIQHIKFSMSNWI